MRITEISLTNQQVSENTTLARNAAILSSGIRIDVSTVFKRVPIIPDIERATMYLQYGRCENIRARVNDRRKENMYEKNLILVTIVDNVCPELTG